MWSKGVCVFPTEIAVTDSIYDWPKLLLSGVGGKKIIIYGSTDRENATSYQCLEKNRQGAPEVS